MSAFLWTAVDNAALAWRSERLYQMIEPMECRSRIRMKRLKNESTTAFQTFCRSGLTVVFGAYTLGYLEHRNVSFTKIFKVEHCACSLGMCGAE